jgi:methyl-accepting chemotaxis protein
MGNGTVVMMKEIDAPVIIGGRHWGGVRMAYKL